MLGEDRRQESFFRRYLRQRGLTALRYEVAPRGRGSAVQWVLERYPDEVKAVRQRRRENVALLVVVDGDNQGVAARKAQLDKALTDNGMDPRGADERIALCVPTWSIESWLLELNGVAGVDEGTDKKRDWDQAERQGAGTISAAVKKKLEGKYSLPSCTDAQEELKRIL